MDLLTGLRNGLNGLIKWTNYHAVIQLWGFRGILCSMKKGDTILVSWVNLYGGYGRKMARCEILRLTWKRSYATGRIYRRVRIRDPKGHLWWHALT
jgi:hypothetical protein